MRTAIATITFDYNEVYAPERLEVILGASFDSCFSASLLKVTNVHVEDVGPVTLVGVENVLKHFREKFGQTTTGA